MVFAIEQNLHFLAYDVYFNHSDFVHCLFYNVIKHIQFS